MRVALFLGPGRCEIVERAAPVPGAGQALLRVEACGVCGTDLHIHRGEFPARFPLVAGHEFAGVVEALGPGVEHLRCGETATVDPNIACGVCRPCRRGLTHLCRDLSAIGVTRDGGFATHCLAPASQVLAAPPGLSFAAAALAEPVACCVHGIARAEVRSGDVVVIIGAGLIGLVLLQLALARGASAVIVSEPEERKRRAALGLGAACAVDPRAQDLGAVVREAADGAGADVVIECVGGSDTAQEAVDLAGEGGRVLLFGVAPPEASISISPYDIYRREVTLTGSFTNPFTQAAALALLASGRVEVESLISHRLPLAELPQGLELLASGQATKVLIEPQA